MPKVPQHVALITGCSSGIGAATAARFAEAGWITYATARRPETLADLEAKGCRTLALDVTDDASMTAAVKEVEAEHGSVGALINNAGYAAMGAIETLDMADVRREFETNVFGVIRMAQLVAPGMRHAGTGRIVITGSIVGKISPPGFGAYAASKHALEAIADSLRAELKGFGIAVSLIEPGPVKTRFADTAAAGADQRVDDPVYGSFHRRVEDRMRLMYSGALSILAQPASAISDAMFHAASSPRPKPRYPLGPTTRAIIAARRLSVDPAWDLAMGIPFQGPKGR